jgi:hypothetical protein
MRSETNCILAANGHTSVGGASRRMSLSLAVSVVLLTLPALHCAAAYGQSPRARIIAPVRLAETGASAGLSASLSELPLSFEANLGRTDPEGRVRSRGKGYSLFLTERGAVLAFDKRVNPEVANPGDRLAGLLGISGEHAVRPALCNVDLTPSKECVFQAMACRDCLGAPKRCLFLPGS